MPNSNTIVFPVRLTKKGEKEVPLSPIDQKVLDLIDKSKNDNVALLQKSVQIPSFTGNEADMGEFLVREMAKFGLNDARIVRQMEARPNILAHYQGKTGKPSITVYAHYDTVPIGDITQWHYGPLSGEMVGNRIYGRGAIDHKFPISALLYAFKAIRDAGVTLNGNIVFVFVCDEEFGGHHGMRYLIDQGMCNTDYFLYAVCGTDGKTIGIAGSGRVYYLITVKGKTTHTGTNEKGINAAYKAAKLIIRLEKLGQEINERKLKMTTGDVELEGTCRFSVNMVNAYLTGNNVPDRCVIQIDRRLMPKRETWESGQAEIQAVIDELKKEDPEFQADVYIKPEHWMNCAVSVPDRKLIEPLQRSADKVLGFSPVIGKVSTGSNDCSWFTTAYPDRAVVAYGISRGSGTHSYDEFATTDGLIDTTKVYALFLMDLLGVA
jgi:acetylornithine deacetylase/succinyl-diaminopimelate desuccinylase-like protein